MDLKSIEKKLRFLAIPNLTKIIITTQIILFLYIAAEPRMKLYTAFIPAAVIQGEIWRIFTFLFIPPAEGLFFLIIAWYFLFFIGKSLEEEMGDLRYTLFILVGWIITVITSLLLAVFYPNEAAFTIVGNTFLMTSLFLAFARFNPDYQILLFFILPIKVKWLAYLTWLGLLVPFFLGGFATKIAIIASVANFILFFGKSYYSDLRYHTNKIKNELHNIELTPNHRCIICGRTDKSNPELDFRYCSKCQGNPCYCEEHLKIHHHITKQ